MFCGNEKIPPPIIDPTTSAINAPRRSFCVGCDMQISLKESLLFICNNTRLKA
jgi:hypothetical protein